MWLLKWQKADTGGGGGGGLDEKLNVAWRELDGKLKWSLANKSSAEQAEAETE